MIGSVRMKCENNVANLADQKKDIDIRAFPIVELVRQMADQRRETWRSRQASAKRKMNCLFRSLMLLASSRWIAVSYCLSNWWMSRLIRMLRCAQYLYAA